MRRVTLLIALVLALAACGEEGSAPTTDGPVAVTTTTAAATTTTAAGSGTSTSTTAAASTTTTSSPVAAVDLADVSLALEPVASGFEQPVFLTAPPDDERLFVVDQPGIVWVIAGGDPEPFLDISDDVAFGGERGLLGLAFHPRYEDNGRFFVNYTDTGGDTRIVEYRASADPMRADAASARVLLTVAQPASNHNGGMIAFGPEGYLWIGMGDGGGGGDAYDQGQRADTLLGSMLRIDIDGGDPYAVPADNPYVDGAGAPEVWAIGLRNPWRFSFDGDLLYLADVGQNAWEEVDVVPAAAPGLNYGWPIMEGTHCYRPSSGCDTTGLVLPVAEYSHDEGCSVTGGYVYRGSAIAGLEGTYLYSDYCNGTVRGFRLADGADPAAGSVVESRDWADDLGTLAAVTSFGRDAAGELYVVSGGGDVSRIVAAG